VIVEKVMIQQSEALPVLSFTSARALREWLIKNHATSQGVWVRIAKRGSGIASVTFDELLDEGLCFGWSESMRRKGDDTSYLQRFTPRRTKGTRSQRNQERIARLISEGRMTPFGLAALEGSKTNFDKENADEPNSSSL
jgi:uncharacterized protein YdeI (YjbR/CyaY-like superfamily)